jgi:hypothetical protein
MADGKWQMAYGGWQMADGIWIFQIELFKILRNAFHCDNGTLELWNAGTCLPAGRLWNF